MRPRPDFLMDVMLALAPGRERRRWHGQGALPLSVRINNKLVEILIAGSVRAVLIDTSTHDVTPTSIFWLATVRWPP